jgi:hypothetical protein
VTDSRRTEERLVLLDDLGFVVTIRCGAGIVNFFAEGVSDKK